MGREVLGWPLCYLNLHRFDNRQTLAAVCRHPETRFTIYHGMSDNLIPIRMSTELANEHHDQITLHPSTGGHNDVLLHLQKPLQVETLKLSHLD
jgi:hypothetical protein